MSISSPEVWQRIERAGLATAVECRQWAANVLPALDSQQAPDGLKLLQRLIELGKLTNYQAKIIAGQSSQPLNFGPWHVLQRVKLPLWTDWYVVRDGRKTRLTADSSPSHSSPTSAGQWWARLVDLPHLEQMRWAAPSLARGLQLSALEHPGLQKTAAPEMIEQQNLLVLAAPITGQSLLEQFATRGCAPEAALSIIRQLASGLALLHQQGLVHGRVLPDRIYLHDDLVTLAVDPICLATATAQAIDHSLIGCSLIEADSAQFMAPEFHAPGQWPTPATDVYSLGCVWWWLLTGQPPASGNSIAQVLAQHSNALPSLPKQVQLSAPLLRCLQHALGRNLGARFPSAVEFQQALDVALAPPTTTPRRTEQAALKQPLLTATKPLVAAPVAAPVALATATKPATATRRRRRANPWIMPTLLGCGAVVLLLGILKLSGALESAPATADAGSRGPSKSGLPDPAANADPSATNLALDPREERFELRDEGQLLLWAPPTVPNPLPIDLLPPGGQLFASFRPATLLDTASMGHELLAIFDPQLSPLLAELATQAGVPMESISQITVVFHAPLAAGGMPQISRRFSLNGSRTLGQLKTAWSSNTLEQETIGSQTLLVNPNQLAYYVATQPLVDSQAVSEFSVGPVELMRDVAELQGAAGPLVIQMEKLWRDSDRQADLMLFGSAPFVNTEGSGLLASAPAQLASHVREQLGGDMRAFSLRMNFDPLWYVEAQSIGAHDREAGKVLARLQQQMLGLPNRFESQLLSHSPHPYWRAIALRFPQMLRTYNEYTRFGVEDGRAIINTYLPSEAASNILLAGWSALQYGFDTALAQNNSASSVGPIAAPLTIDEYLARPIRLSFDQEPIENALQLVGEEANGQLPSGTTPLRFALDGDAFEKAGITRNQQLRNFAIQSQAVRVALTEIAKRGNPVTTVTDTRQEDQRLIWVVAPDPEQPGRSMIALTTRDAARALQIELPPEFRN
jgi:hypothetical protein